MTFRERIAQAISQSFHEEGYIEDISDPNKWNEFLKAADAVLFEMMRPTPTMIERGDWVRRNHDNSWHEGNETLSVYRSIIDAAITDWKVTDAKS